MCVLMKVILLNSISSSDCCTGFYPRQLLCFCFFFTPNSGLAVLVCCHFIPNDISLTPGPSGWPLDCPAVRVGRRERKTVGRLFDCCNSPLKTPPSHKLLMQSRKHCVISLCCSLSQSLCLSRCHHYYYTTSYFITRSSPSFFIYFYLKWHHMQLCPTLQPCLLSAGQVLHHILSLIKCYLYCESEVKSLIFRQTRWFMSGSGEWQSPVCCF